MLSAFISLKVAVEEDSIVGTAAVLLASRDAYDYVLVGDYSMLWGPMLGRMMDDNLRRDIAARETIGNNNDTNFTDMYDNIGLWKESSWEALGDSLVYVALSRGMSQEDVKEAISNTDLKRVRFLAPYQKDLIGKLTEVYEKETADKEDFDSKTDVQRLVRSLQEVTSSLKDEDDAEDVEEVVKRVINAVKTRYAHWD